MRDQLQNAAAAVVGSLMLAAPFALWLLGVGG